MPRREERFKVRVPVTLHVGRKQVQACTGDVSFRGLFICTDDPPALRQLISVELELPPDDISFKSHGMSVYVLRPGESSERKPGVGVQFYAQGDTERRKWERFVTYIKGETVDLPSAAIEPVKRKHPRIDARFAVHPRDPGELQMLFSRDISKGGMFLETDMQLDQGHTLALTVYHPITCRAFTIDSVVRRRSAEEPRGLGVEFTNMDEERRSQFQAFVKDGLAALEELDEVEIEVQPDPA